jgi:hypothetical protein
MKKQLALVITFLASLFIGVTPIYAAGVSPSSGGSHVAGQTFTVTVTASGVTFDALQGTISVSGPVSVLSFTGGGATWLPGKAPSDGGQFVGIVNPTNSLTVAKITLKGTGAGNGSVSVSGVKLASNGSVVSTNGGSSSFTIQRAPTPPGSVSVTSTSHPDPNQSYTVTSIALAWEKPNGSSDFSYVLDQNEGTVPPASPLSSTTSISYDGKTIGTYYFHIRAHNGDGFGPTSTFAIHIRDIDPAIDTAQTAATILLISKTPTFATDLTKGTIQGITLSGTCPSGFILNLTSTPKLTHADGSTFTAPCDTLNEWHIDITDPIASGFYSFVAQGQKDKVLTPASTAFPTELSLAKGGHIAQITLADAVPTPTAIPTPGPSPLPVVESNPLQQQKSALIAGFAIFLLLVLLAILLVIRRRRRNHLASPVL